MPGRAPRKRSPGAHPVVVTRSPDAAAETVFLRVWRVVLRVPRGRVATYGQIAELAGCPGAARAVGAALKNASPRAGLPWQRVIGKRSRAWGRISILDPIGGAMQRAMLEAEGVEVTPAGQVSLVAHGWRPKAPRAASRRRPAARASRR